MKTIFVIRTSEDGLLMESFSNIKAMYNYLVSRCEEYTGFINTYQQDEPIKFTYANFLKEIRYCQSKNMFFVCSFMNIENSMTLDVMECNIHSKWE